MSRKRVWTGVALIVAGLCGLGVGFFITIGIANAQGVLSRPDMQLRLAFSGAEERARIGESLSTARSMSTLAFVLGGAFVVGGIVVLATGRAVPAPAPDIRGAFADLAPTHGAAAQHVPAVESASGSAANRWKPPPIATADIRVGPDGVSRCGSCRASIGIPTPSFCDNCGKQLS